MDGPSDAAPRLPSFTAWSGRPTGPATRLAGGPRSQVWRIGCDDRSGGESTVVIKFSLEFPWGVREEAALGALAEVGCPHAVRLLASSSESGIPALLLQDLGTGPTLADQLLNPGSLNAALTGWAYALGGLHRDSGDLAADFSRRLAELSPFGAPPLDGMPDRVLAAAAQLPALTHRLGVSVDTRDAQRELRDLAAELDVNADGSVSALSPGDTCPSNAVATPAGHVLLDFEDAAYRNVAWDAAYLLVPWPTCWFAWAVPDDAAEAALSTWMQALGVVPQARERLRRDVELAATVWRFVSLAELGPAALDGDPRPADPRQAMRTPSRRAVLQQRMRTAAQSPHATPAALSALANSAAEAMDRLWGAQALTNPPLLPSLDSD